MGIQRHAEICVKTLILNIDSCKLCLIVGNMCTHTTSLLLHCKEIGQFVKFRIIAAIDMHIHIMGIQRHAEICVKNAYFEYQ
jgi:hypothetical protein